ncbi:CcsA-related protein [Candidatus Nitrotoga sp. BS]|uniref:cytochrome C assembly family protein n=1 Tax=Candidatus Nitrotoga sp. BS TaxID=2890408 RepID=UPI001EF1A714|nr:cytochrome c biogenesis protein CcsA [Candidatus Nitrotoga sp. BS]CAH1212674.1 CcsA-related protein [Candidatus Nitrotoga sp. BS]
MSNLTFYVITFLAYSVLAAYFWRAQSAGKVDVLNRGLIGHAVLLPLALHAYLLYSSLFSSGDLNFGLINALSLILWLTMLVYWLARFFYPIASLQTLVLPLAAGGVLLPALFPAVHPLTNNLSFVLEAHILAAMSAYSLFTIAVLHAGLMSLVEKRLHQATLPRVLQGFPPLLTMETLLFRIIGAGFVLLTMTLASGIVFSDQLFGKPWHFNHKMLFGFISWCVFAVLLLGHQYKGWRGRTAVRWTMSGFIFLLLAYLGTQFVLEVLLHR